MTACQNFSHAVPGETTMESPDHGLAIHGESFGPSKALLLIGFAERPSP